MIRTESKDLLASAQQLSSQLTPLTMSKELINLVDSQSSSSHQESHRELLPPGSHKTLGTMKTSHSKVSVKTGVPNSTHLESFLDDKTIEHLLTTLEQGHRHPKKYNPEVPLSNQLEDIKYEVVNMIQEFI